VSVRTAQELAAMLEGVILRGTGQRAQLAEYRLAGKSGTTQKLVDGRYSHTEFTASFGGFGPVGAPRLVALVVLDTPRGGFHQGGQVAAPIFGRIMEEALLHLRAPADEEALLLAADRRREQERTEAPPAPPAVPPEPPPGPGCMPDLRNLSLREAVVRLASAGCRARFEGSGIVVGQEPPAGAPLAQDTVCRIHLAALVSRLSTGAATGGATR
jgi:membrane peptidoglycan carboxypeptidase